MAQTTGPVLAIGAVTVLNQSVFHDRPMDWRIPIATGAAAAALALIEKAAPGVAEGIAWLALATVLLTRINGVASPTESFLAWWNAGPGKH
jgi:hypothetical protein